MEKAVETGREEKFFPNFFAAARRRTGCKFAENLI